MTDELSDFTKYGHIKQSSGSINPRPLIIDKTGGGGALTPVLSSLLYSRVKLAKYLVGIQLSRNFYGVALPV